MTEHSLQVFRRKPAELNCAQAVLDAWQAKTGVEMYPVADFKPFGGGRAPDNECGALYAACACLPLQAEALRAAFKERVGATACRALKRELRVPCEECVATAADLLQSRFFGCDKDCDISVAS